MKQILFLVLSLSMAGLAACSQSSRSIASDKPQLCYDDNGEFRILQLTDLHIIPHPDYKARNDSTLQHIARLVDKEKPQLIAITGDIIVASNASPAWRELCALLDSLQTPYFINFGNHDTESDMSKSEVIAFVQGERYCLNDDTLSGKIAGEGNGAYAVRDKDGRKLRNVIYIFDSHAYPDKQGLGTYDWIKSDQIAWYRAQSEAFRQEAQGIVPSLAFFHIPLPEYNEAPVDSAHFVGHRFEPVCAPEFNSGLLTAFLGQGDVMGVFVGHDHNNDYLLNYHDSIALTYGRKTGYVSAYDEVLERGGRMIILREGEAGFDTYIITSDGISDRYAFRKNTSIIN